jgi:outer membrane protein assembly factor BamB
MKSSEGRAGAEESSEPSSLLDRILQAGFFAALLLMVLVAGAVLSAAGIFPGPQIARAYQGGKALYDKMTAYDDVFASDLWHAARSTDRGVTVHHPFRAQEGVTLYTSGHEPAAWLISMDGEVLHEWRRPFSTVWHEGAAVKQPQPDSHVYFRKAMVYPNGDLLVVYEGVGDTPYGYGLVKMDKDSRPIWTYMGRAHHDVDVGKDGRVYVLTQDVTQGVIEGFEHLRPPRLDDFVVVLSPDGEELKKVPLLQAFVNSPYKRMLNTVPWFANGDYLHTNTVDVISAEQAAHFPFASEGQVLLSMRDIGAIAVLDLAREQIVWALQGPWVGQHDPDILPNGNILLFDNYGHYGEGGISRVIEFDPRSMEIVWSYTGSGDHPFESAIRSGQERLPNGNTLITESDGGRLLEVTRDGDVVWEYLNPERRTGHDPELTAVVSGAQRIDPASLDPDFLANRPG